jgi:hypothetical protein
MTIDTCQPYRTIVNILVEYCGVGELLAWPENLIPAATFYPLQLRLLGSVVGDFFSRQQGGF